MGLRLLLLAAFLLGMPNAEAQKGRQQMRERVQERIRAMRTARLVEALDLDEQTTARLFPVVNKYSDAIAEVGKDSGEARRALNDLLSSGKADDATVNKIIDRLVANKGKVDALEQEMIREVRKVISPLQAAKLVIVLPEINRQIRQRVRQAARQKLGGGPPPADGVGLPAPDDELE